MTKTWHKVQTAMVQADVAMDKFHRLLIENRLKDAQDYLEMPFVKEAIASYYGTDTYQTLVDEMDDALTLKIKV